MPEHKSTSGKWFSPNHPIRYKKNKALPSGETTELGGGKTLSEVYAGPVLDDRSSGAAEFTSMQRLRVLSPIAAHARTPPRVGSLRAKQAIGAIRAPRHLGRRIHPDGEQESGTL